MKLSIQYIQLQLFGASRRAASDQRGGRWPQEGRPERRDRGDQEPRNPRNPRNPQEGPRAGRMTENFTEKVYKLLCNDNVVLCIVLFWENSVGRIAKNMQR